MVVLDRFAALPWAVERPDLEEFLGQLRPAWMAQGTCREVPTAVFFPGQGDDLETPKAVCEQCPVLVECLAYTLARPELRGIWGAMSDRQRARMRRAMSTQMSTQLRASALSQTRQTPRRASPPPRLTWANSISLARLYGPSPTVNRVVESSSLSPGAAKDHVGALSDCSRTY